MKPDLIIEAVTKEFEIKKSDLCNKNRKWKFTLPRYVVFYFYKKMLPAPSWKKTAAIFNKNHATAIYGYNLVKNMFSVDKEFAKKIYNIENNLKYKNDTEFNEMGLA